MIIPAICYKEELTKAFDRLRYSDKMLYYNGCICDGRFYCIGENDDTLGRFQYAIVDNADKLVGYIGYTIDYYSNGAYNFGLISLADTPSSAITSAILQVMKDLQDQNIHRIEFRAISNNPAVRFYDSILNRISRDALTSCRKLVNIHVFKDRRGNFQDSYTYEIIKWNSLSEKFHAVGVDTKSLFNQVLHDNLDEAE